jgi:hypothetical protein
MAVIQFELVYMWIPHSVSVAVLYGFSSDQIQLY